MDWKQGLVVLTLAIAGATAGFADPLTPTAEGRAASCGRQPIVALETPADGWTRLCSRESGLSASMRARGLVPGDAYTVWWVYIDDPESCEVPGECGLVDFGGENPLVVFGRMDSGVADSTGRIRFTDALRDLQPRPGAQVWLLVFGHGSADAADLRHRARQLLTPEDPHAGAPHLGNFVDGPLGFPAAVSVFGFAS